MTVPRRITAEPGDHAEPGLPEGFARHALTLAMRGLDRATLCQRPVDMGQALSQLARSLKALGAFGPAETYLTQALRWAAMLPGIDARVDLLCELAEVSCAAAEAEQAASEDDRHAGRASRERARDHAFAAAGLAGQTTDAHWEVKVLLRVSDVLDRCGDHEDAASMQNRAISLMGLSTDGDAAMHDSAPELPAMAMAPGSTLLM
ncbi:hypothetical protein [Aquabacterium sp.]|uniref:hypothetical protein n=1 Tax=Aquabacterium sp. TaxID=1872578 RepID=UPI002C2EA2F2|nr:hypothetical protein [Aquabacterium sp.]HSW07057.1 hypothetical protein [Aquabacterium sp.]